jgi:PKD domain
LQPTVTATADGEPHITVRAGATVLFDGIAASPIAKIAKYEWDFEGNNSYDCDSDPATPLPDCGGPLTAAPEVALPAMHVYGTPGTYVATVRIHDDTDNPGPFDGIENVARVIVIVE